MFNVKEMVAKAKTVVLDAHHRIKDAIGGPTEPDMPLFDDAAHNETKEVCEILANLTPGQREIALTILKFDT